jgi:drug/metabolite transporter (DMT)-like permease
VTRRATALFVAMCLLWGVPYLLIRVAVAELSPAVLVVARTGLAALLLLPLAWRRGELRRLRGHDLVVLGYAASEIAVPFLLIAYGEQHVTSSLAGLLLAAVPLCVVVLALWADPEERVTRGRLLGLVVGLLGVALVLGVDAGEGATLLGSLAILAAAVCYAAAALLIKRTAGSVPQVGLSAAGLTVATLALGVPAAATLPDRVPSGRTLAAVAGLAVFCTALALVLFIALVAEVGAARATVITYVNPVVAVLLGVALLDERVTPRMLAGLGLVLAGSWLSTRPGSARRPVAPPAPPVAEPVRTERDR